MTKQEFLNKLPIEAIMYSHYIQYNQLDKIMTNKTNDSQSYCVYIDLNSVFKELLTLDTLPRLVLSATAINLAAHMRQYFNKKGRLTTIYLVWSDNQNKVTDSNKKVLEFNLNLLSIICRYLPKIYYVSDPIKQSCDITSLLIKSNESAIDRFRRKIVRFIVTKDPIQFQLCELYPFAYVLRPKKNHMEDKSRLITYNNCMYEWILQEKGNRFKFINISKYDSISPELLGLLISLTSYSNKGYKSIYSINKGLAIIQHLIDSFMLPNGNITPNLITPDLFPEKNSMEIYNRFKTLDLRYRTNQLAHSPLNLSGIVDNVNIAGLTIINEQVFLEDNLPLNLQDIFQ